MVILITLVLLEVVLRVAYPLTPAAFRLHLSETLPPEALPAYAGDMGWALRGFPSQLLTGRALTLHVNPETDGDLYLLTCAAPPPSTAPGFTVQSDEFGFRADQTYPLTGDNPDVLVLGDSFGASSMIQVPFWQGVSERPWGLSVSGAGPTEQVNILRAVLATRQVAPDVIVFPYFEGNDLLDATGYTVRVAEHTPPALTRTASWVGELYSVQLAAFLWARSGGAAPGTLPPAATRAFSMWVDQPPAAETPTPVEQGGPAWGWAFDTRAGLANTTGIAAVRLHGGATCDGPLLDEADLSDLTETLRGDLPGVFGFPQDAVFNRTGFRLALNTGLGVQTVTVCVESETGDVISQTRTVDVAPCLLPLRDATGADILFFPRYLGMATLSADVITAGTGYAQTETALLEMQALADSVGAELLVLYLPTKIHTYIDLVTDDELRKLGDQFKPYGPITGDAYFEFGPQEDLPLDVALERLRANIGDQRAVIAALAAEHGLTFVDATPALQAAAAAGAVPFHPADTHINDAGSAVVREVLQAALAPYLE